MGMLVWKGRRGGGVLVGLDGGEVDAEDFGFGVGISWCVELV